MSPQLEFLRDMIAVAQRGDEAALKVIRWICERAVKAAPADDLITIATCLYDIGVEMQRVYDDSKPTSP